MADEEPDEEPNEELIDVPVGDDAEDPVDAPAEEVDEPDLPDPGELEFANLDDEHERRELRARRLSFVGAAAVVVLVFGGLFWFIIGGDGDDEEAVEDPFSAVPGVTLIIPPKAKTAAPAPERAETQPGPDTPNVAPEQTAGIVVPSVTVASYAKVPPRSRGKALAPVPDPALVENSESGPLPRIAADGRRAWQVYARPFNGEAGVPRIAVVVGGLGLSRAATEVAINRLPADITLAFDPYADELQEWVRAARSAGHEVLISLPMEPIDFPKSDPGPFLLRTDFEAEQNLERLETVLARAAGYVGVLETHGSGFVTSAIALEPVLKALNGRGLLYVASSSPANSRAAKMAAEIGLPAADGVVSLDAVASRAVIDANLNDLEAAARKNAFAVATAEPYPITLERLAVWAQSLSAKKIALAPVSAVISAKNAP